MKHYREVTFTNPFNFPMKTVKQSSKKAWKSMILNGKKQTECSTKSYINFFCPLQRHSQISGQNSLYFVKHVKKKIL